MTGLTSEQLRSLLQPYLKVPLEAGSWPEPLVGRFEDDQFYQALAAYLDVLLRWNERTNLTAIRDPREIVRRHFGESLFAARLVASRVRRGATVLDLGSGAGFPGLPLQLALPELDVTLAESQGKKAAFLREAVRVTGGSALVWAGRAEQLPPEQQFDVVTMRAVDDPGRAMAEARRRLRPGGMLVHLCSATNACGETVAIPGLSGGVVDLVGGSGKSL